MANIRIGTQLDTGRAWSRPSRSVAQPHWKTAVITPYAAAMLSRFITAALMGMTTERKTIASSSTETATTNAMTSQSRPASMSEMSEKNAVPPVSSAPCGSEARTLSTRSPVRASVGP